MEVPVELTCGERVVRCLTGGPNDRVPFGVGLGWEPWEQTLDRWRRESANPELYVARELGFEASFRLPHPRSGIYPPFETKVIEQGEEFVVVQDERGITSRRRRDEASMPQFLDYPVKTIGDWDRLKEERLRADDPSRITLDWDVFRQSLQITGEAVQVGEFPYGVFGTPRDLMGFEGLMIACYEQPHLVRDMMDHLTGLWLSVWEKVAAQVQIDHIHIWEDMSGKQGSLISPRMVEEFMMPCYDRIADFARAHGVRLISVDTDGNCSGLVPMMMDHGVNVFMPFEVQAGNDIFEYRAKYLDLGIMGGLDKRALAATRADVNREIERAARMVELGRYVPMFDHLIPPDAKWENFRYAAERIRYICYGESEGQ